MTFEFMQCGAGRVRGSVLRLGLRSKASLTMLEPD